MRIEGIEVESFGCLSGSFRFSGTGLSVGSTPNEGGKSALGRAIVTALYGASKSPHPLAASEIDSSWILLHVRLDDGTSLAIARDLARGTVQISDGAGIDRTSSILGADSSSTPGEKLLGLVREEFERAAFVSLEKLTRLDGDTRLARLLSRSSEPAAQSPDATVEDTPARFTGLASEDATAESSDRARRPADAYDDSPTVNGDDFPESPAEGIVQRLRERRTELDRLSASLESKTDELRRASAVQEELRAEVERVGALSGAVPADVEKLGQLVELLKIGTEKKEQLRREEAKYRRDLSERGLVPDNLTKLRTYFEHLEVPEQEFLDAYRQTDTVHRGNQALLKSEIRFDETRIAEIDRARERSARLSVWPFTGSAALLLASIGMSLLAAPLMLTILVLVPALGAAAFGARCLWLAKKLATGERAEMGVSLGKKKAQIAEIEKEQRYATGRLAVLAEVRNLPNTTELIKLYEEWRTIRGELRTFDGFERRRTEQDKEISSIREKMGSFSIGGGANTSTLDSVGAWEALLRDYVRFFEAQRELDVAQEKLIAIENDLAIVESDRAAIRTSIEDSLKACGVDPSKDLDEAIERVALRAWTGEVVNPTGRAEPEFGIPGEEPQLQDASWQALVSSRAEAIVRRFLPNVRTLEVGPRLDVTLQMEPTGPRLDAAAIERTLSPATRDLLAFSVRIAALEARSSGSESTPVLLDDPLVRVDDARYDRALEFLVEDACAKGQVILLTCHEVRTRWFLEQRPTLRSRVASIADPADSPSDATVWAAFGA